MSTAEADHLARQLLDERELLLRTDAQIEGGLHRLHAQERLVSQLQASGRNTVAAERLRTMLESILAQWERHRELIAQRIAYLENEDHRARPGR